MVSCSPLAQLIAVRLNAMSKQNMVFFMVSFDDNDNGDDNGNEDAVSFYFLLSTCYFSLTYASHPSALAPRTAALAFIKPDTRNWALPLKIGSTLLS